MIRFTGDSIPGPNQYSLPSTIGSRVVNKRSSPAHSMAGRGKSGGFSEDLAKAPGPGQYNPVELDIKNRKAPAYSMSGRPQGQSCKNAIFLFSFTVMR